MVEVATQATDSQRPSSRLSNNADASHDDDAPPPYTKSAGTPQYTKTVGANIALNTDFLSHHPLSLTMNGEAFSRDFSVVDAQGKTILRVDCPPFSMSHEMTLVHAPSGQSIFTIHKKQFSMSWRYSAELPPQGSGKLLFETETSPGFFSGGETLMKFRNAMTAQMDQLQVELHTYTGPSQVKYKGKLIADIDRERLSFRPSWSLNIHVPGVDPLLIVVLALVISDRIRTKNRRS